MGIQPPALGAFAVKRRIRVDFKLRDVPIIAGTSFAPIDHDAKARGAGRNKGCAPGQLLQRLIGSPMNRETEGEVGRARAPAYLGRRRCAR